MRFRALTRNAPVGDDASAIRSFKAALVQAAAAGFDLERGFEKVARLAGQACAGGAALVVFPEALLPAYPRGIAFGTVIGDRTLGGRDQSRRYFDASEDVPGPAVGRLAAIASSCIASRSRPGVRRRMAPHQRRHAHAVELLTRGSRCR
jgi:hypothetical protein